MAQRHSVRLSRPAQLGLAALAALAIAGLIAYYGVRTARSNGYSFAVRFPTASGVAPGAPVYLSGVSIGTVTKVEILPDTTVDFVIHVAGDTDIPRDAMYTVQSTFTGSPTVNITLPKRRAALRVPPTPLPRSQVLPRRVLPVAQQPVGSVPLSIEQVMSEGQALGARAQRVLARAKPYGPRLQAHLQHARANAGATSQELRSALPSVTANLKSTIARAQANASRAQAALKTRNQAQLAAIAAAFERSAGDMERAQSSLASLKSDPQARGNLQAASAQLRAGSAELAGLSRDMAIIAGNSQTKAQLRDAGERFRAILKRL